MISCCQPLDLSQNTILACLSVDDGKLSAHYLDKNLFSFALSVTGGGGGGGGAGRRRRRQTLNVVFRRVRLSFCTYV